MTHSYAQTTIQLLNQLRDEGYSAADINPIADACRLAMSLFSGRFQPSGKPFMSHVVGTASVLAALHAPAPVVAAGLLHNVYRNGDFGDGSSSISNTKREIIRRAVGEQTEEYLVGFATLRWNAQTIPAIRDNFEALSPTERQVVLLCLADQLEHELDLETLYFQDPQYHALAENIGPALMEIAEKLGYPFLAAELKRIHQQGADVHIPGPLRVERKRSFVVVPRSYCLRLPAATRRQVERLRERLRPIKHRVSAAARSLRADGSGSS